MNIHGDGLSGLPTELLCNIFRLAIDRWSAQRDRCRLMLVCHQWREYVEGSALLWTDISTLHGPTYVRRALDRSKGAMVDLYCWLYTTSHRELEAFMIDAAPHIARWRSLAALLHSSPLESGLAPLTTTQAPRLEMLNLFQDLPRHLVSENAVILFGGAPAPPSLKELTLYRIPVAIEPLSLSGLVSLKLTRVPTISTPQLLEILRGSPGLETLSLDSNPRLVAIGTQASNIQPIELPKFVSLFLGLADHGGTNCILSNIRIPNRRCVVIRGNIKGASAGSVLFTSDVTHILHTTMPTTDLLSSVIRVEVNDSFHCTVQFRGIELALAVHGADQIQQVLGWFADGLGSEAADCPVHLILKRSPVDPVRLATVPTPLVVKYLSISDSMSKLLRDALYTAMVRAPDSTSSGWLLQQIESLSVEFERMESQKQLISMLRSRYKAATLPDETESRCPTNLRCVELRGQPRTEELVKEIKGILLGVNVFWVDE